MKTRHLQTRSGRSLFAAAILAAWPLAIEAANPLPTIETKDTVQARVGVLRGGSLFTLDAGGRSGQAGDRAVDFGMGTGPVYVKEGAFLNDASRNDEMTFAFWMKLYDNGNNSAFWANSVSSGGRGWQAHLPWGNTVYFDTAGCCTAPNRINASITTFSGYTDVAWWNDWHFYVFSKKGENKQIWIDGIQFLDGSIVGNVAAPLPTDFTDFFIGGERDGASLVHGLVDDFAVFGTALSDVTIGELFTGTLPGALPPSDKLMAYWNFNEAPAEGQLVSLTPTPDTTGAAPNLVQVVHIDGSVPWDASNVTLKIDNVAVTPTFTRDGTKVTVKYVPTPLLTMQSTYKATLTYPGAGGAPLTLEWQFAVGPYTTDTIASRIGVLTGGSRYTSDAGGHTGVAGDYAVDFARGTGPVYIQDGSFLNQAAAADEMSFALWIKGYDNANNSAFWGVSPSSTGTRRGWQAHLPNGNNIYFDTAGCCDPPQRLSASITTYSGYTDLTWWNDWHFYVFSKKGENKQVWIDGLLFLDGSTVGNFAAPLPTDFTELFLGSDGSRGSLLHGIVDDFAVFGTALSDVTVNELYAGTLPTALPASDKLMAYWNFNDIPPGGFFLSFSPAPNATNALPNLVEVLHQQGSSLWDLNQVGLKIDGAPVTPSVTRDGSVVTVSHVPSPIFAQKSTHTAALTYQLLGGGLGTKEWSFTVGQYTKDVLHQYLGVMRGPAQFTADAGGRTGAAGDYAVDFGKANAGQSVHVMDATFLNAAADNDEMAVGAWQKLHNVASSSMFWGVSPSSSQGGRGFQMHSPWGDNSIYFDTAGCCDAILQRISAGIGTFPGYSGAPSWWQSWHYLVFQKKGTTKEIWIDGELFLTGDNTSPLPTDFTAIYMGYDAYGPNGMQGILDDVAVFKTALDEATVKAIFNGTRPVALPPSAGLIALWDFNDSLPTVGPKFMVTRDGANVTVTSDPQPMPAGFVLQTAASIQGPWTTQVGVNTPITVPIGTENAVYLRAFRP